MCFYPTENTDNELLIIQNTGFYLQVYYDDSYQNQNWRKKYLSFIFVIKGNKLNQIIPHLKYILFFSWEHDNNIPKMSLDNLPQIQSKQRGKQTKKISNIQNSVIPV